MRRVLIAAFALSTLGTALVACDDDDDDLPTVDNDEDFAANLSASSEIPTPTGSPTATGAASLDLDDNVLKVTVTVTGNLTSDVTMAHIHGPASTSGTADIVLDFVPSMSSVISAGTRTGTIVNASFDLNSLTVSPTGVLRVTPEVLIGMLNSGQAYVNVHTETNPTGEIRGQITDD